MSKPAKVTPLGLAQADRELRPEIPDEVLRDMAGGATAEAIAELSADDSAILLRALPALCGELLCRRIAMRTGIA